MLKEYTGKVDLLMSERKEAKEVIDAQVDAIKQQEAARNSYQMLMPLALPAPGIPGGQPGFGGMPDPSQQFGGAPPGAYGAAAGYTGAGYGGY
jgi:clathrin heavy chain